MLPSHNAPHPSPNMSYIEVLILSTLKRFFFLMFIFERKSTGMGKDRERERETEYEAESRLTAVST